ncbi:uncharacterized protein [Diadema setosum]|uniref:uncharacterized protein n=1 Tax=Diadema setosum TaxID=31175 RepID=UPI003B3A0C45
MGSQLGVKTIIKSVEKISTSLTRTKTSHFRIKMQQIVNVKAVAITLLAVALAAAFADDVRQVKKQTQSAGWLGMARHHYGPYVRDTRVWNSRPRVGRMSPPLDTYLKRNWGPRQSPLSRAAENPAKRAWDFALSPEGK